MPYLDKLKQKAFARQWIKERRDAFFAGKACIDCGSTQNLELDHIDRSKKVSHRIWSWSEERRLKEIAKCAVRCKKCHLVKTLRELVVHREHGTYSKWKNEKCRCSACVQAHRDYQREYRERTGIH
jgi:hypothetical protein